MLLILALINQYFLIEQSRVSFVTAILESITNHGQSKFDPVTQEVSHLTLICGLT